MRQAVFFASSSALLLCWVTGAYAMVGRSALPAPAMPDVTRIEYFCSPGFEPGRRGTCVAVPSRAEIELFVDQPVLERQIPRRTYRRRRHGIRERY